VTDRDLLDRLREGDHDAFDAIFRAHYPPLVALAERMIRERAIAEEIVQDVMLELWKRRATLSFDVSLRAYLFQATRNRVLNHFRHEKVERLGQSFAAPEPQVEPKPQALLTEEEIDVALREAVTTLPDRCREVFELSRVQGLRYAEIAAVMGISVKRAQPRAGPEVRGDRRRDGDLGEDGGSTDGEGTACAAGAAGALAAGRGGIGVARALRVYSEEAGAEARMVRVAAGLTRR
jgi:RNA polymerase sigma-70 factor, ECF subfamily